MKRTVLVVGVMACSAALWAQNVQGARTFHQNLEKHGIKPTYFESVGTAHEWQTWRRSLRGFAPLLFR